MMIAGLDGAPTTLPSLRVWRRQLADFLVPFGLSDEDSRPKTSTYLAAGRIIGEFAPNVICEISHERFVGSSLIVSIVSSECDDNWTKPMPKKRQSVITRIFFSFDRKKSTLYAFVATSMETRHSELMTESTNTELRFSGQTKT